MHQHWTDLIRFVDVDIALGEELVDFLSSIRVRVEVRVYPQKPQMRNTSQSQHTAHWHGPCPLASRSLFLAALMSAIIAIACAIIHTIVNGIHGLNGSPLFARRQHRTGHAKQQQKPCGVVVAKNMFKQMH